MAKYFLYLTCLLVLSAGCVMQEDESKLGTERFSYRPMQCEQAVWDTWLSESDIRFIRAPDPEEVAMMYYETVHGRQLDITREVFAEEVCEACTVCPRGYDLVMRAPAHMEDLLLGHGWVVADRKASSGVQRSSMMLASPAFADGERIPSRFTCDGSELFPELLLTVIPPGTESLVLIVEDPDAPRGTWDHLVAFDIPVSDHVDARVVSQGVYGMNSWDQQDWGGPCPPSGEHRYVFTLSALDTKIGLAPGVSKEAVREAMVGHVLGEASLTGLYSR